MTFREQVGAQIADSEGRPVEDFSGDDWWQLQEEEQYVFEIDPLRFPRMVTSFWMFEIFLGQVAPEEYELAPEPVESERNHRPDLVEKGHSNDGFQHFASDYAGLTFREAAAMYAKNRFWHVRAGITYYADEPEPVVDSDDPEPEA
jgi:hypothetical protein